MLYHLLPTDIPLFVEMEKLQYYKNIESGSEASWHNTRKIELRKYKEGTLIILNIYEVKGTRFKQ